MRKAKEQSSLYLFEGTYSLGLGSFFFFFFFFFFFLIWTSSCLYIGSAKRKTAFFSFNLNRYLPINSTYL